MFFRSGSTHAEYQPDFVAETDAEILMIEAQERMRPALDAAKNEMGDGVDYHIALLGPVATASVEPEST